MISIVYSTIKSNYRIGDLLRNTSGVSSAEVIEIVNPGIMSLTEAYQKGLEQAKNDIVVFIHDDVRTPDRWGRKILKMFNTTDYGIIGLAGTTELNEQAKWWEDRTKMVGIVKHTDGKRTWENKYSGSFPNMILPTVNVDGLFIAVHRQRIKHGFDTTIPGFHFYDIDFSFGNFLHGVKVGVTTDIRVIHRGLGETDQIWEENRKVFIEKYKDQLPKKSEPNTIIDDVNVVLKNNPKIGIIIHGSNPDKIKSCITNIKSVTKYDNYKIFVGYSDVDDVDLKIDGVDVIEVTKNHFATNVNKIVTDNITDEEIIVLMTENSTLKNDVISLGLKTMERNKNCGSISARVHNPDGTIYNSGYELWNLVKAPNNKEDKPESSLLVNLIGNGSYYTFKNENYFDTIGGTKEFLMVKTEILKQFPLNETYKKGFYDLEFNLKVIQDKKINIVLGNGVVQMNDFITPDQDFTDDLNKVFLPFVYSQDANYQSHNLNLIDKHIKNYIIPKPEVNE